MGLGDTRLAYATSDDAGAMQEVLSAVRADAATVSQVTGALEGALDADRRCVNASSCVGLGGRNGPTGLVVGRAAAEAFCLVGLCGQL